MPSMLYNRALLLARIESTFRTDSIAGDVAAATADSAFLVENPQFSPNISQIERANVKPSLSKDPSITGRKTASISFLHEVRSNGVNPPVNGTVPKLSRLLQACAMARTFRTGAGPTIGTPKDVSQNPSAAVFTLTGTAAYTGTRPRTARITFTAAATVNVQMLAEGGLALENNNAQAFANAGVITLGAGATATVSGYSVNAAAGDVFEVDLLPVAHVLKPVSDLALMDSLTLYLYYDGLLHKLTGARGTWSVEGSGDSYGKFNFTFTGDYVDPVDAAIPANPGYETTKPRPVELAQFGLRDGAGSGRTAPGLVTSLRPASFSIDLANDVQIDENINAVEAYEGALIVGRSPRLTANPGSVPEASFPFWSQMKAGTSFDWRVVVGNTKGNMVLFRGPSAQLKNISYGNRNSIRTYEIEADLTTPSIGGDDEISVELC